MSKILEVIHVPPSFLLTLFTCAQLEKAAVSFFSVWFVSRCAHVRKVPPRSTESPLGRQSGQQQGGGV